MVVKSTTIVKHLENLAKVFQLLKQHDLTLNPDQCSFGVRAGEFFGFVLTQRGIEANPCKCSAIIDMKCMIEAKEVQILTGRVATLLRFKAWSADKVKPLFQLLRKNTSFQWIKECE